MASTTDQRTHEMERHVPDIVDLTVMAVESGMGIDGALDFITQRLTGPLAEECHQASRQAQTAADPREVWLSLCHRLNLPDFTDFIGAILQGRQLGASLGNTLRQKSEDIRQRRLQKAREEANQLPVKLVVVNVVLVPCMIAELICLLLLPLWLALLLIAPAFAALLGKYKAQGRERETDEADRRLSDALVLAASGLRVGHGLDQSIAAAAESAGPPVGPELKRVSADLKNGVEAAEAVKSLGESFGEREIGLLVTGLQIQRAHGGSLADILDRVSRLIGERVRVRGEIRALTAQAQFSAYLMIGIPLALAVIARLLHIKLAGVLPLGPFLPMLVILTIFVVQSGVLRVVKKVVASVDRYMP